MTESEFLARADDILDKIQAQADGWFEHLDIDVDANRSGQVLTLVFDSTRHVVINSQGPLQEMWVAAPSGAFHYRFDGRLWQDTRGGKDLAANVAALCSEIAGQPLTATL